MVLVWRTVRRGRNPNCTHCRAIEKAPEIMAWLAITVAAVARMTMGRLAHCGPSIKNGFDMDSGSAISSAPWPK